MKLSPKLLKLSNSTVVQAIIFGTILTLIFLNNFIVNIGNYLDLSHNDAILISSYIKHYLLIFQTGNFKDILDLPFFYGFQNSVLLSEHYLFYGIASIPMYLFTQNYIFIFNLLAILMVIFNFFSMYLFVKFVTGKIWPSIIAGSIFAFNPYVMSHFPDIIIYYTLGWIPLIFLFIEKFFKKPYSRNIFFVFLFLTLQALTTMTYVVFLSVILPIYVGIRIVQFKFPIKKFINRGSVIGVILFGTISICLIYLYSNFYVQNPTGRTLTETSFYSAWVSDYLFSPSSSFIYGNLRQVAIRMAPQGVIFDSSEIAEHNLFLGLVPIILFILSFIFVRKTRYRNFWIACLCIVFISFLLSLGPVIHFKFDLTLPGPYEVLYKLDPFFKYIRVPARFVLFVMFFVSVISAMTIAEVTNKLPKNVGYLLCFIIISLIFLEFYNNPLKYIELPNEENNFYSQIRTNKKINIILELPMGKLGELGISYAKNPYVDVEYIFWQTNIHNKKILNGYSGIIPAKYQERQRYLTINFPTKDKILLLKKWGADGLTLHKDQFVNEMDFEIIKERLDALGIKNIYNTDNLYLYDLKSFNSR